MPVTLSFNPITRCATKMGPSSPTPLQQWCKSTVVTLIGLSNLDKVNSLPLPSRLKEMLGQLTLSDFIIDGEKISPESHSTGVYQAICLLTNTVVNLRVAQSVDDVKKDDPGYMTSFEEDGHWIVIESPTESLHSLIQECKAKGTSLSEKTIWQLLKMLVQYITLENVQPNVHLSTDCIKICGNNHFIQISSGQDLDEQPGAVYEAPEVLNNNSPDSGAFVWSIACIVYEAIALEPAFHDPTGTNPFSVYMNITNGIIPPLPTQGSPELLDIISQGLVHDKMSRMTFEELKKIVESH